MRDPIRIDLTGAPLAPAHIFDLRKEFARRNELPPDWGSAGGWAYMQIAALSTGIIIDPKDLDKIHVGPRMSFGGIMVYEDATVSDGAIEFYRQRELVGAIVNIGRPHVERTEEAGPGAS